MPALIVVDVQNDFCPGGALAVAGGDQIVAQINNVMADYDAVILTQDWHPAGHSSFASSNEAEGTALSIGLEPITYRLEVCCSIHLSYESSS